MTYVEKKFHSHSKATFHTAGVECFIPLRGFTVGGSKEIEIPQRYQWPPRAKEVQLLLLKFSIGEKRWRLFLYYYITESFHKSYTNYTLFQVYCMGTCDSQDTCVGFDIIEGSTKCLLTDMSTMPTYSFDTYLRGC